MPWGWTDLVLLLILAIAGFILINLVATLGLAISGVNVQHIQKSPNDINLLSIFIQVFLDLGLLAYLAAQMRLRFRSPFWRTIGWRTLDTGRIPPLADLLWIDTQRFLSFTDRLNGICVISS